MSHIKKKRRYSAEPKDKIETSTLKAISKSVIQRAAEATDELIDNKIAGKITKVATTS